MRSACLALICVLFCVLENRAQDNQAQTQLKVKQAVEKKSGIPPFDRRRAGRLPDQNTFGIDRDKANAARSKFTSRFPEYMAYEEYQQPNWVVLVGDF